MVVARPHDLLRVSGPAALPIDSPEWVVRALRFVPWVVVRRDSAPEGLVAVGVRGFTRSERFGTTVAQEQVVEAVAPEALAHRAAPERDLPALRTLRLVRVLLDDSGLAWGPTGSVGFELATGQSTVTTDSDLDVVIRVSSLGDALPLLGTLHREFCSLAARVDCHIETFSGALALAELVGSQHEIMLRTTEGPRLVARAVVS